MNCKFCLRPTETREGLSVAVCASCWKLLQNPNTALPLIRGHLTLALRGKLPEAELKKRINQFMTMVADWKRPG
jgi:hypothetical protein